MTESEILLKMEALSSVLYEYLAYYKPIYQATIERQSKAMPRSKRREYEASKKKDFQTFEVITGRFSRILEKSHEKEHSDCIDLIHEALSRIEILET